MKAAIEFLVSASDKRRQWSSQDQKHQFRVPSPPFHTSWWTEECWPHPIDIRMGGAEGHVHCLLPIAKDTSNCLFKITYFHHFFQTKWQDSQKPNFTPKKQLKAPKKLKMSLKKSNICIFFTQSGKIYTWQKNFIQTCLWCLWQIWGMLLSSLW